MKGFTAKTSGQSRSQLQHLLDLQDDMIRPMFKGFNGTVVKTIGDAFMVTFDSPTNGVLCGVAIQKVIAEHNVTAPEDDHFEIRIAVNSGEVNVKDNDVFGEPVNIAARIESIAEPGEVYFTEAVYLSMNKNEIPSSEVGHRHLKGIPEQIKVYKVLSEVKEDTALLAKKGRGVVENIPKKPSGPRLSGKEVWQEYKIPIIVVAAFLLILLGAGAYALLTDSGDEFQTPTQPIPRQPMIPQNNLQQPQIIQQPISSQNYQVQDPGQEQGALDPDRKPMPVVEPIPLEKLNQIVQDKLSPEQQEKLHTLMQSKGIYELPPEEERNFLEDYLRRNGFIR
jgi:hypothetical protein